MGHSLDQEAQLRLLQLAPDDIEPGQVSCNPLKEMLVGLNVIEESKPVKCSLNIDHDGSMGAVVDKWD